MANRGTRPYAHNSIEPFAPSTFTAESDFGRINDYFEQRPLDQLLLWSLQTFGDKVAQVTSFGPTGMVILDMLARLSPGIRVITLDTQFLFDETYALIEEVQRRYPITLDIRRPALSPEQQAESYGPALWRSNPDLCCHLRKVAPLDFVMSGLDAWLTGLRRDQSFTRESLPLVGWDRKYNLVKINPLAHWSRGDVWKYIVERNIPYNALHDRGYASIGCSHCTRPTTNANDERSGRWQNHVKTECGIHLVAA
ncbi:MAG: Phosphoadenosine phosphosulfate reductase [Anaerolineae bacterium]|nr:Phosphoadenosine phosphosulfate reductase [Anaerolineae bacterium]